MVQNLIDMEIFNTPTHQIFNMNITLKLKGNVLRMAFLAVLRLAGMNRSDISEECTVQLYWVTDCFVGG